VKPELKIFTASPVLLWLGLSRLSVFILLIIVVHVIFDLLFLLDDCICFRAIVLKGIRFDSGTGFRAGLSRLDGFILVGIRDGERRLAFRASHFFAARQRLGRAQDRLTFGTGKLGNRHGMIRLSWSVSQCVEGDRVWDRRARRRPLQLVRGTRWGR